ncbi:ACT domain-containing protein ACR9 [Zea mays]|uniref:ACT domain-containing protein ACR9 n=2 Tax=Zea mays TaxID=4577 RepID=A0A1D6HV40_MAIZE|nr:ACT domain-containing protein ACR9 [Zea mays]
MEPVVLNRERAATDRLKGMPMLFDDYRDENFYGLPRKYSIVARVEVKFPIEPRFRDRQHFVLSDINGAKIEAITYMYETVKHFDNLLHEKHVYKMHNVKFSLHPGEFNFRHLNGPMELCLNQQAIVEPYTFLIQMAPFPKQIFLNLADIAELPNRTLVDIMAIVVHMDTIHRTMWGPFRKIVIMDARELLHRKERQDETCSALTATLGPSISCEVVPAEGFQQGFSSLPPEIAEELFRAELADTDSEVCSSPLSAELRKVRTTATVNFDNSLSPAHTLVQIVCADQKGLIYDILRTMKDCNIQIFYGRFRSDKKGSASKGSSGCREVDLFVKQVDGKKVTDPAKQDALRSRLRSETLHSLRVMVVGRGPDTELLVANRRSRRVGLRNSKRKLRVITRLLCNFSMSLKWRGRRYLWQGLGQRRKPKRPGSMHAPLRRPGTNGSVKESELLSKEN